MRLATLGRVGFLFPVLVLAAKDPPPTLAVIATVPGEAQSTLRFVAPGARELPPAAATLPHLPYGVVRAAPLPGTRAVVAVADEEPSRDPSWAAYLLRLAPGEAPRVLADRVCHASRPLPTPDGRVLVERGRAGPPRDGELRVDELTVDEIDPAGGARTLFRGAGYAAHLAGLAGDEVWLYRVGPEGADLALLSRDGALRPVLRVPPFARDFSVDDRGRLVYAGRRGGAWTVERVDRAGALEILDADAGEHPAPFAWAGGPWWNAAGAADAIVLTARSRDGAWAAGLRHPRAGGMPQPIAVRAGEAPIALPAPPGVRVEIAGFVGGAP